MTVARDLANVAPLMVASANNVVFDGNILVNGALPANVRYLINGGTSAAGVVYLSQNFGGL